MPSAFNCMFGTPIHSDVSALYTPSFSSGSWLAARPLVNLQDRVVANVARSSDALAASTKFDVDLKTARSIGLIALVGHNLTVDATVTITGDDASSFASPNFAAVTVDAFHSSLVAEDIVGYKFPFVYVFAAAQNLRYWRIEITDTGNPAGYIDIGRLVVAPAWQTSVNFESMKLGILDGSQVTESDWTATFVNERPGRRIATFALPELVESEAIGSGFKMQRTLRTFGQFFFVLDPTATTLMHEQAFLCRQRQLSELDRAPINRWGVPFSLIEEL